MVELAVHEILDRPTVRQLAILLAGRIATTGTLLTDVLREVEQISEADALAALGSDQ
jgi:hypothetical protein